MLTACCGEHVHTTRLSSLRRGVSRWRTDHQSAAPTLSWSAAPDQQSKKQREQHRPPKPSVCVTLAATQSLTLHNTQAINQRHRLYEYTAQCSEGRPGVVCLRSRVCWAVIRWRTCLNFCSTHRPAPTQASPRLVAA